MAENIQGSFAISILKFDNTLYLVKGSNPIYLIHFKSLGLYLYSSTKEIMLEALIKSKFNLDFEVIHLDDSDIISINSMGIINKNYFNFTQIDNSFYYRNYLDYFDDELDILLDYCTNIGIDEDDVYTLLDYGFEVEEIEYIINDQSLLNETLKTIKQLEY